MSSIDIFQNEIIKEILEHYRVIWALGHASSLMGWDSETYMPKQAYMDRGTASSEISVLSRKLLLDEKFLAKLDKAKERIDELNEYEKGVVRVLDRAVKIYRALPEDLIREMAIAREEARVHWVQARYKSDFNIFKPYLDKNIELSRKAAEYLGYDEDRYDALLDLFEEGLTYRKAKSILDQVASQVKPVFEKVYNEELFPSKHTLEDIKYDTDAMKKVNREVLDLLNYPWERARLDVSAHPFTTGISLDDVRITTRYEGYDFRRTLYSVLHEYGHALYDLQIDPNFKYTPLEGGASLGVHESQSRFWENIIGRSREFTSILKPILDKHLDFIAKYDEEELYRYFNIVRPTYIRVDSDQLTYDFHIVLRFRMEHMFINGELSVDDAPETWNNMMEEFLGIRPKKDSEGILQDIHWSIGLMGYFPTYTLGNILSAQISRVIEKELGRIPDLILEKKFTDIQEFLKEKIHKYGGMYKPEDLIKKATGEGINPAYYIEYLKNKFLTP